MRTATPYGAFIIVPFPSQPQIGICHGFFVPVEKRGKGHAHILKDQQAMALSEQAYDYGICTVDGANEAQKKVLAHAKWKKLDEFKNARTGGMTEIWGSPT